MNYTYFPGCTLRTKAKELDRYARASAEALGFILTEPENWQCCGGVFQTAKDEIASKLPSVRALIAARDFYRSGRFTGDFITLTTWNEWTEGNFMEPSVEDGYAYLEAVRDVFGAK